MSAPILVTGATGFVGSRVVRQLLERGESVRVLARPGSPRSNLQGLDVDYVDGDLTRPDSLAPACRGCGGLFHVAADYRLWVADPQALDRTNVEGTRSLLLAAKDAGIGRIVYTSSVAVLGTRSDGTVTDETTPVTEADMVGLYKRSKFRAEEMVKTLVRDHDLPIVIVNPSTPVGPGDIKPTPTGRVILDAANGRIPAFVDTGLNIVHVDDVAHGHLLAFDRGAIGERYVLGGDDLPLRDMLRIIAEHVGRAPPTISLPRRALFPMAYLVEAWARSTGGKEPLLTVDGLKMAAKKMYFSSRKAETELGYSHRPAQEAIRDAVDWFRPNPM